jgi:hypothetical protein
LLFCSNNLCSIYSTNAWNSSSKVARFTTWLTKMFTTFCCESVQQCCGKKIKPKLEARFRGLQMGYMLQRFFFAKLQNHMAL